MHFSLQNRNVVVFYGSQTGTAEEFATRLAKDASRYGMKGMVADPEECDMVRCLASKISKPMYIVCFILASILTLVIF